MKTEYDRRAHSERNSSVGFLLAVNDDLNPLAGLGHLKGIQSLLQSEVISDHGLHVDGSWRQHLHGCRPPDDVIIL